MNKAKERYRDFIIFSTSMSSQGEVPSVILKKTMSETQHRSQRIIFTRLQYYGNEQLWLGIQLPGEHRWKGCRIPSDIGGQACRACPRRRRDVSFKY